MFRPGNDPLGQRAMTSYAGFEQGPIRPPSEAKSLLLRVSRNCPWNRCAFCPVYKGERFSRRPVEHVLRDVDAVRAAADALLEVRERLGGVPFSEFQRIAYAAGADRRAVHAAHHFLQAGGSSVFLQDANALMARPRDLAAVLERLRRAFPSVERVTTYARARTVERIPHEELARLAEAGLGRVHVGMESGSDAVLAMVDKGVDQDGHVAAGIKIKRAGLELSEYVMPGLGGRALSGEHARETSAALRRIDPDFIRIRTLALPEGAPLTERWKAGRFDKMGERETAAELLTMLESLRGVAGRVASDHVLNLLPEVEGELPRDRERLTAPLRRFLALEAPERVLYQIGKRCGVMQTLADLNDPELRGRAEQLVRELGATPESADAVSDRLMRGFI
jgi:radical SAM superfamily enzyme YgiQ (UPF0313 family)